MAVRKTSGKAVGLVPWLAFVAFASVAEAQVADNHDGAVKVSGNELLVESKRDDPAAVRVGAPDTQRGLGKISFDILGSSRDEVVLIQGKQTEDGLRGGEFYLGLKKPGFGTTDDAMVDALVATVAGGFHFNLPIYAPNLTEGAALPTVIVSPNGKWRTYMQDDGNLVTYEAMPGNWFCPRWSIFTGPLPACSATPSDVDE
jgi:hypothetical protein